MSRRSMILADKHAMLARGEPFIVHPAEVAKFTAVYETDPEIILACIVESGTFDTSAVLRTAQRIANALPVTYAARAVSPFSLSAGYGRSRPTPSPRQ